MVWQTRCWTQLCGQSLKRRPKKTLGRSIAIYSWSRFEGSHSRDRLNGRFCRHQETDDTKGHKRTRGHQYTIQQTNHFTPLFLALALAYERLQTWHAVAIQCGVGLLVSTSRTPPHWEGHSCLPSGQWTTTEMKNRWVIPPTTAQWTWGSLCRSSVVATTYPPPHHWLPVTANPPR